MLSLCLVIQRGMRVTPLGFCFRVIVNEKLLNLEKTTSSVRYVLLLIYEKDALSLSTRVLKNVKCFYLELCKFMNVV